MYNKPPPVFPGVPPTPPSPQDRPLNWSSAPTGPPQGNPYPPVPPYTGGYQPPGPPPYYPPHPSGPMMPPMPHPSDPSYPAWYKQWYEIHLPGSPVFSSGPPPPPPQPSPATHGPSPAKKPCLDLGGPPPPPPHSTFTNQPTWQAAKRKAVIYTTPRLPTPEPPASPIPLINTAAPPPPPPPPKAKMQWFYDGESWVYSDTQPETREIESKPEVGQFMFKQLLRHCFHKINSVGISSKTW